MLTWAPGGVKRVLAGVVQGRNKANDLGGRRREGRRLGGRAGPDQGGSFSFPLFSPGRVAIARQKIGLVPLYPERAAAAFGRTDLQSVPLGRIANPSYKKTGHRCKNPL